MQTAHNVAKSSANHFENVCIPEHLFTVDLDEETLDLDHYKLCEVKHAMQLCDIYFIPHFGMG